MTVVGFHALLRPGHAARMFSTPKYGGRVHYVDQEVTVQGWYLMYATALDLHCCSTDGRPRSKNSM